MSSKLPGTTNLPPSDDESSDATRDLPTEAEPVEVLGAESDELLEVQSQLRRNSGAHPVSTLKPSESASKKESAKGTSSVIDFFTSHPTLRAFQNAAQKWVPTSNPTNLSDTRASQPTAAGEPAYPRKGLHGTAPEKPVAAPEPTNTFASFAASVADAVTRAPAGAVVVDAKLLTGAMTGVQSSGDKKTANTPPQDDAPASALLPENVQKELAPAKSAPQKEIKTAVVHDDSPVSALAPQGAPLSDVKPAGPQASVPAPAKTSESKPMEPTISGLITPPVLNDAAHLVASAGSAFTTVPTGVIPPKLATQAVTGVERIVETIRTVATEGTARDDAPASALSPENVRKEPATGKPVAVKFDDAPASALAPENVRTEPVTAKPVAVKFDDAPASALAPENVRTEPVAAKPVPVKFDDGPVSALQPANAVEAPVSALRPANTELAKPKGDAASSLSMEGPANLFASAASTAMRFPTGVVDPKLATQAVTNIQAATTAVLGDKKAAAQPAKSEDEPASALAPENVPKTSPKVEPTKVNDARMPAKSEGDVPNPAAKVKDGDLAPSAKPKEGDVTGPAAKARDTETTGPAVKNKDDAPASGSNPANLNRETADSHLAGNRGAEDKTASTRLPGSPLVSPSSVSGLNKESARSGGTTLDAELKGISQKTSSAGAAESSSKALITKNESLSGTAQKGTFVGGTASGVESRTADAVRQSHDEGPRLGAQKSGSAALASGGTEPISASNVRSGAHLLKGAAEVNVAGRVTGNSRTTDAVGALGNASARPQDVSKTSGSLHHGANDGTTNGARRAVDVSNGKSIGVASSDGQRRPTQVGRSDGDSNVPTPVSKGFTTRPGVSIAAEIAAARVTNPNSSRTPLVGVEPSATRSPSVSPATQSIRSGMAGRIDSEIGSRVGSKTDVTSDAVAKAFGTNRNGFRSEINHAGRRYLTGVELVLLLSLGGIRRLRHNESGIKPAGDQCSKNNGQKFYELILNILETRRQPLAPTAKISGDLRILAPRNKDKHEENEPNRVAPSIAVSALIALMSVDRVRQLDLPQLDADGSIPVQRFLDQFEKVQSDRKLMAQAIRKILARMDTVSTKGKAPKMDQGGAVEAGDPEPGGASTPVGDVPPPVSLRRRYWTITPGDTLTGIASHVFNDSAIGWLIAKLNEEKISVRHVQTKQVMEIQSRQTLSLPTPEEIHEFYKDQPPNPNNLVTVVIERAVDIELAQSSLNVVFGRSGPTFSGLPSMEISDDRQSEDT